MKLKKVIAIAMASAMVFGLAACGNSAAPAATETPAEEAPAEEAPAEETPAEEAPAEEEAAAEEAAAEDAEAAAETAGAGGNIGVCIYKFDDAFMTTYRNALQEILEGKGYTVTFMDGKNDQAEQNNQINNFIAQKVDALIINPVMTSAADQIIATVKDAGVPTVLINREPTADQMSAYDKLVYVGCDARQSGTMQGELILDTANKGDINGDGKVSYIMIQGDPENVDAQYRTEFSVKALTDAGMEVEELDLQRGDWDRNKGQEAGLGLLNDSYVVTLNGHSAKLFRNGVLTLRDIRALMESTEKSVCCSRRRSALWKARCPSFRQKNWKN